MSAVITMPQDPSPSSQGSFAVRSALDVCAFVDELPSDAAGELSFRARGVGNASGAVFVEDGRVCWAAARGLSSRLSDLLAASAKLDRAAMEEMYGACRKQSRPLGEYLVSTGVVSPADLRAALLRHTAESLHVLCVPGARAEWTPRRAGGYSPRFTFRTAELLPRTFAESYPAIADEATAELIDSLRDGEWGVAYVRSPARAAPDPVAVYGTPPDTVEALIRLGRWASSSLDVVRPLHEDGAFVATVTGDGAFVAWRTGSALIAGRTGACGPARLLNRRARARRKDMAHGTL